MAGNDNPSSPFQSWLAAGKLGVVTPGRILVGLAVVSWVAYLLVSLSGQSLHEASSGDNSLLLQVGLFVLAFAAYLAAISCALRMTQGRTLLTLIVVPALAFRVTLLFSDPIEEIDIYRYMWDGAVLGSGISPFRYSPQQVLEASVDDETSDDLRQLVALRDQSPALQAILRRVHFGELPTIYPPVSQVAFAAADCMTPNGATIAWRMRIVRAWFIAYDLGTLLVLLALLRLVGLPSGWAIAHGWCPLVIKEIANSGHLDSLATFLTIVTIYLALRSGLKLALAQKRAIILAASASVVFALAIGAKLYPIILIPVFYAVLARQHGWRVATGSVTITLVLSLWLLWPMLPKEDLEPIRADSIPIVVTDEPPLPPEEIALAPKDPSQSLRAFLSRWEMNDFLFLIVIENVRPTAHIPPAEQAWFSIVPESWRTWTVDRVQLLLDSPPEMTPFLVTRAIMSIAFGTLAISLAWRAFRSGQPLDFLNATFLTIAWFWLLLPTQNPWYWAWAVPFLPFCRNRAWLAVSGLAFSYYLRFWLVAHYPSEPISGTRYDGALFFDYVVTWFEFGPWLIWLAAEAIRGPRMRTFRSNHVS